MRTEEMTRAAFLSARQSQSSLTDFVGDDTSLARARHTKVVANAVAFFMENDGDVPPPPRRRVPTEKGRQQTNKARGVVKHKKGRKGKRKDGKNVHLVSRFHKDLWKTRQNVHDPDPQELARVAKHIIGPDGEISLWVRSRALMRRPTNASDGSVESFLATLKERVKNKEFLDRLKKKVSEEPEATFTCPITQEAMKDPVCAADGQTYEREAIERWLQLKGTSPFTRDNISSTVYPNIAVRDL